MGLGPLSWSDVEAWARLTGVQCSGRDAADLVVLSGDYAWALSQASEKDCPPFWLDLERSRERGRADLAAMTSIMDSVVAKHESPAARRARERKSQAKA